MNVEVTKLPESRVALKIELSPQEVEQALDRTYKQLVQRVNIPGFRKGKAPRPVVERMVGQELFLHEATDEAVRWGYRKAIDQENIVPIDEAEIAPEEEGHAHVELNSPFRFEATVAVRPEVQIPDYTGLRVEREEIEVNEEDVDALLRDIQERSAVLEPTIREAQIGDVLTMNVTGKVEGEEIINQDDAQFELVDEEQDGADQRFPGLSRELVGANRGDIREITLHLPEIYADDELAGKTIFLRILVKEVKRKVLPPLDDDFAQSVSAFQTLDELKDALRTNLESERRMEADQQLVNRVVEEVTSRTFVEIPPILVEEEIDRMMDDMRGAFEGQQIGFETYLEAAQRTEADIRGDMRESAINNVKTSLAIGAVADAENITVSNKDIDAALNDLFRGASVGDAERRRLRSSTTVRSNIRTRLRRQRAIQRLVQIMTGGEEVSPEAAEAMADQTAATADDTQETVAVEVGG